MVMQDHTFHWEPDKNMLRVGWHVLPHPTPYSLGTVPSYFRLLRLLYNGIFLKISIIDEFLAMKPDVAKEYF